MTATWWLHVDPDPSHDDFFHSGTIHWSDPGRGSGDPCSHVPYAARPAGDESSCDGDGEPESARISETLAEECPEGFAVLVWRRFGGTYLGVPDGAAQDPAVLERFGPHSGLQESYRSAVRAAVQARERAASKVGPGEEWCFPASSRGTFSVDESLAELGGCRKPVSVGGLRSRESALWPIFQAIRSPMGA